MTSFLINPYRFGVAAATDPNFANVSLLLHGDASPLVDSSGTPKTITAVGNAAYSTVQKKFGSGSIAFDGTGDYLDVATGTACNFSGDLTAELFLFWNGSPGSYDTIIEVGSYTNGFFIRANGNATGYDIIINGTGNRILATIPGFPINQWIHLALTRSGTTVRFFVDGTQYGTASVSGTINSTSGTTRIGWEKEQNAGREINGYIDDLRITKGEARYTANFTPPTAPFPDF